MTRSRTVLSIPGILTVVLAATTIWLMLHNPSIDGTSRVDDYTCRAPYDTVLLDADNEPGGEQPRVARDAGSRCRALGHDRFAVGVVTGTAALALGVFTVVQVDRRSRI